MMLGFQTPELNIYGVHCLSCSVESAALWCSSCMKHIHMYTDYAKQPMVTGISGFHEAKLRIM